MDSKVSRLQSFVNESKTTHSLSTNNQEENEQSSLPKSFHNSLERLQTFLNKNSNPSSAASSSNTDDLQLFLQKGDHDPILPSLTRKQRILGFMMCLTMGLLCMGLATLYIPVIAVKARKFGALFTFGSLFFLASFSMLWGPVAHLKHLVDIDRLPFSITYIISLIGTIYYSIWVRSNFFTIIFVLLQFGALIWYIVSYIPGGTRGLQFFSKLFYTFVSKTVTTTLSI